jgi:hypothetical protein
MTSPHIAPLAVSQAAACFFALAVAGPAAGQTDLRWRLAPDQQLEFALSQTASTEVEIAGRVYKSSLNVAAVVQWRVVAVDENGAATIEQTLLQLTVAAEIPGAAPLRYDSTSQQRLTGAAQAVAGEFRPLLGKPVRVRLLPTGQIEDAAAPRADPSGAKAPFTANDIRQLLGRLLPGLPAEPVSATDRWEDRREQATQEGMIRIDGQYAARGSEMHGVRPVEKIEATYKFSAGRGREVALEFHDQRHRGQFYFDAAAGRLLRGEIHQAMTLQLRSDDSQVSQKTASIMTLELRPGEDRLGEDAASA